jgi:hypothetical protein
MWSEYLEGVKKFDTDLTDAWKENSKGVLVFVSHKLLFPIFVTMTDGKTGLFSATVASFIIDSYKKLSPDSGDETTFLLRQLSNQLAGFANGTYPPAQSYSPPPPSASIIWVNVLWLLSLLLSVSCALFASLMQQWGRRYLQVPQIPTVPSERARVRSYLFFGTEKYLMRMVVEIAPALIHISVFLFFAGLVIFFFTIFKMVAIVVLVFVGLFGLAYIVLTILPCIDHRCPYRTPMSTTWWYSWHASLSFVSHCLRWGLRLLHDFLYNLGDVTPLRQSIIMQPLETIQHFAEKHRQRLRIGFRRTIVKRALQAPQYIDTKALTWLFQLTSLTEKSRIQKFVASLPGETVSRLFSKPFEHGRNPFREHLSTLLRSCASDTGGLEEHTRRERLLICLNAVHHVAKALIVPSRISLSESESLSVLEDVRAHFANIDLMRTLWTDSDPSIRITARSICALLARRLLHKHSLEESELAWLQEVLGKSSNTIFNSLGITSTVDPMNLDAYVYGVLSHQTEDLSYEQARSFVATLIILTNAGSESHFRLNTLEGGISALIHKADEQDDHQRGVVEKLRRAYEQVFRPAPETQETNT